jgi:hypothetical protein
MAQVAQCSGPGEKLLLRHDGNEAISRLQGGASELVFREVIAKRIVQMARAGEAVS